MRQYQSDGLDALYALLLDYRCAGTCHNKSDQCKYSKKSRSIQTHNPKYTQTGNYLSHPSMGSTKPYLGTYHGSPKTKDPRSAVGAGPGTWPDPWLWRDPTVVSLLDTSSSMYGESVTLFARNEFIEMYRN